MAQRLEEVMRKDHLYLNPKITLFDVALAIGTNKTYLSDYFNSHLSTTFYDFLNTFRVEDACALIKAMWHDGRRTMAEVAAESGFNSLSTFNRYFKQITGMSPKQYYRQCRPQR